MTDIQDKVFGMSSAARAVLEQLFLFGPRLDGDVASKSGRSDLVDKGLCERWNGWNWLTKAGVQFAVDVMLLERRKDRHLDERSAAVHAMRHPEEAYGTYIAALKDAERFMAYFAGETGGTFVGPGTPTTCLAKIRAALPRAK